jgi:uncharacterized Rmd1/YagE family protein
MRCTGYCTSWNYDTGRFFQFLQLSGHCQLYRDVIHSQPKDEKGVKHDIFYFPYGVIVFWGFSLDEEKILLSNVRDFEKNPLVKAEVDEFDFSYGAKMKIEDDEITLQKKDLLTKLAISYAIAQSIKLTVFEETIGRTIEHSRQIPKDLADKGKITLSRRETSRKMGELYLERSYVNLHSDMLDTPEFFWEHADLEPLYRKMAHYLDINKRVDSLNRRLTILHELFEILNDGLNHQHSARLEWTIIFLIIIEISLALMRDLFHLI